MAANEQKGFIVYLDSYDMISMLSQEQKGALLDAMFSVYGCCERPEMDQATAITFVPIERYLKDNREKWLETQKQWADGKSARSEQASKAANARWEKHREQCSDMLSDAQACSSDADACSSMPEQCSDMLSDALVISNMLQVRSNNNISLAQNEPAQTEEPAASTPCSADAEPVTSDPLQPGHADTGRPAQPSKKTVDEHFEAMWTIFPNKRGKNQVSDKTRRKLMAVSVDDMRVAIDRYLAELEAAPPDRQMLYGSTWFNGRYTDYIGDDYELPPQIAGRRQASKPSARSQHTQYCSPEEIARREEWVRSIEE